MTKFTVFVFIVVLRIAYHPSNTQKDIAPFASTCPNDSFRLASPLTVSSFSIASAKIIRVNGGINNHKVILNWVVAENETADKFEVEKSYDGKNFIMVAVVFGTDKPKTDNYLFYENAGNKKVLYRIKLITKEMKTEYSSIIKIDPGKPEQTENTKTDSHVYYC